MLHVAPRQSKEGSTNTARSHHASARITHTARSHHASARITNTATSLSYWDAQIHLPRKSPP